VSKVRTSVGGSPDPQAYAYVASVLHRAETIRAFNNVYEPMIEAVSKAMRGIHAILEQYYFEREAEARWEDDGGPCG
jgi:hypothetical protein